jgi:hypothetical protein
MGIRFMAKQRGVTQKRRFCKIILMLFRAIGISPVFDIVISVVGAGWAANVEVGLSAEQRARRILWEGSFAFLIYSFLPPVTSPLLC